MTHHARGLPVLMPPINRYMTRQPWTMASTASLLDARKLMHVHEIRHLPIVDNGQLVGVLSERDILRLEPFVELRGTQVCEAMSEPPLTAHGDDAMDNVVRAMGERRLGCVVIVKRDGSVDGIFTASDACRALAEVLELAAA
jgi:CBS domain-containing protein